MQTARITEKDLEAIALAHVSAGGASEDASGGKRSASGGGYDSSGAAPFVGIIHRLDQPVEGIVLMAKAKEAAAKLSASFNERTTEKKYLALTRGSLPEDSGTLTDFLLKGKNNLSSIVKEGTPGAKKASLSYRLVQDSVLHPAFPGEVLSLYEITLHTGRHHQIRVQLAGNGCPIAGDGKYGPTSGGKGAIAPLCLCAASLSFTHPSTGERMNFKVTPGWLP